VESRSETLNLADNSGMFLSLRSNSKKGVLWWKSLLAELYLGSIVGLAEGL